MRKLLSIFAGTAIAIGGAAFVLATPEARGEAVMLYKDPQCGCCEAYADYLRVNGFSVTVTSTHDLLTMSRDAGIPDVLQGCHLSFINEYVVSGHVPVSVIDRLLSDRPDIKGITLPGMPMGAPGMDGAKTEPFTIYEVGSPRTTVYATE